MKTNKLIGLSCKMSQKQQRNHKTCTKAKIIPARFKKFKDNKRLNQLFKAKKTAAGTFKLTRLISDMTR